MPARVHLLGPMAILDDRGTDVAPRAMKPRIALGMLCLNAERLVATDTLVDSLWPCTPPRTARAAVHVHISTLRKQLAKAGPGSPVVLTTATGYLLKTGSGQFDHDVFTALMQRSLEHDRLGRTWEASEAARKALALWSGPALADLRGNPGIDLQAARLDESRNSAYQHWLRLELRLGRNEEVISTVPELIGQQPLWEDLHQYLMLALYRSGRVAGALSIYQRFHEAMVRELGIEPSHHLRALHQACLRRATWIDDHTIDLPFRDAMM